MSNAAPPWINVNAPIVPLAVAQGAQPFDAVVATGFQTVQWSLQVPAVRRYYFVQMMEHNQMRQLYSRALFLLKASRYEGRACAPVEAMACGTTCARAVVEGDDDLLDRYNCLRTAYDYDALLWAGRELMNNIALRKKLQRNGLKYAERNLDWDGIVPMIEDVYGVRG